MSDIFQIKDVASNICLTCTVQITFQKFYVPLRCFCWREQIFIFQYWKPLYIYSSISCNLLMNYLLFTIIFHRFGLI